MLCSLRNFFSIEEILPAFLSWVEATEGIWDKLTGVYWKQRKQNERKTSLAHTRDRGECDKLIQIQLIQRIGLQEQLVRLQEQHETDRTNLIRDLSHMTRGRGIDQTKHSQAHSQTDEYSEKKYQNKKPEIGNEPEA